MLCDDFLNMRKVMRDFLNERIENVDITDTADLMALASLLQASRRLELDDGYGAGEGGIFPIIYPNSLPVVSKKEKKTPPYTFIEQ